MNCNVKWNGEKIKIDEIIVYVIYKMSGTVDISVVRMVIGLAH